MSHFQSIYVENYKSRDDMEYQIVQLYNKLKHHERKSIDNNDDFTLINCDDTTEVAILLKEHRLQEYSEIFNGRKIKTLKQFKLLSDSHLKDDLGIPLGDRLLINSIINKLKEKDKKD